MYGFVKKGPFQQFDEDSRQYFNNVKPAVTLMNNINWRLIENAMCVILEKIRKFTTSYTTMAAGGKIQSAPRL